MLPAPFSERSSGLLLHPSSLPGPFGVGDLGPAAHEFLEFLARAGQRHWQMLPVGPIGGGHSPYDSHSAFAGNRLFVSLEVLVREGWLDAADLATPALLANAPGARYEAAFRFRERRLNKAFRAFEARAPEPSRRALERFVEAERAWLDDHCLFSALKSAQKGQPWTRWPHPYANRERHALERARRELAEAVRFERFVQFEFARQWAELRSRATELGVRLLGDVPMFVSHDSVDVWAERGMFLLDERGERSVLAGVPPDYFAEDGQLWGNPVYDWNAHRSTGYAWWIARLGRTLARFDAVRLDHFIGFARSWVVPAGASSARDGYFLDVPGEELLLKAREAFAGLPFIAEDLGALTDSVVALRDRFELPGMRVLEFAFASSWREYQPHRYPRRAVVYTGTHDNDTIVGWLGAAERAENPERAAELRAERQRALDYAGSDGREPHWDLMRTAMASTADTCVFPIQDVLGRGSEARMNVPGTPSGNWTYRLRKGELTEPIAERLRKLSDTYERIPEGLERPA